MEEDQLEIGEDVELMMCMKVRRPEFMWFHDVSEIVSSERWFDLFRGAMKDPYEDGSYKGN